MRARFWLKLLPGLLLAALMAGTALAGGAPDAGGGRARRGPRSRARRRPGHHPGLPVGSAAAGRPGAAGRRLGAPPTPRRHHGVTVPSYNKRARQLWRARLGLMLLVG